MLPTPALLEHHRRRGQRQARGSDQFSAERSTTQMARQRGHHRYRLLPIFFRTSTGEQPHWGHGTTTRSGLAIGMFLGSKERPARLEGTTKQVASHTLTAG